MQLKVFTAFSGYDSQCMALDRLHRHNPDFNYELVGWAEIDKYAIAAHNAVYPQWAERNYGDIAKIDWAQVPDFDLFTYSSPCQDFSQAGKQAGGTEGSGTRSSLLWECRRAILAKKLKYLLMENVAALVSQKFIRLFNAWQLELESYGYRNFAKVLNAKDYGVPQNRERIFMVSVLDEQARYEFPEPMPLPLRLKDVLEDKVDSEYLMPEDSIKTVQRRINTRHTFVNGLKDGTAATITTKGHETNQTNLVTVVIFKGREIYDGEGLYLSTTDEFFRACLPDVSRALKSECCDAGVCVNNGIRKLTERECFRLMDVPEEYIDRIQAAGISRSQQYKMAGNSIVVSCMYHIWRKLWIDTEIKTLTLF